MPNIKSAKKRVITSDKSHERNMARRSEVKTCIRKLTVAIENNDFVAAQELFRAAESKIAKAKSKGLFKKTTAARKISRLARKIVTAKQSAAAAA